MPYLLLLNLLFCCIMLMYHYLMLWFNVNQSLYNQWNRTTLLHGKFHLKWNLISQFSEINQLSEFTDIANVRAHTLFTMMFRFNIVSFTVALILSPIIDCFSMFDFFRNTVFNVAQSNAEFFMLNFYVLFLEIVISYVELKKIAFLVSTSLLSTSLRFKQITSLKTLVLSRNHFGVNEWMNEQMNEIFN